MRRALIVLLLLVPTLLFASVKEFKKEWEAASAAEGEARGDKQVAALGRLKGSTTADAAQAALGVAVDPNIHWKAFDAALELLKGFDAEPIRAWALKQVVADKDAR